jgi:hypothetical protein
MILNDLSGLAFLLQGSFDNAAPDAIWGNVPVIVILFPSTLARHDRTSARRHIRNFNPGSQVSPEIRAFHYNRGATAMAAGA